MRACISLLLLLFVLNCHADDKVRATYHYVVTTEQSVAQAEQTAIQRARLKALADKYGIFIQQLDGTNLKEGNLDFSSQSTQSVRGIWIKDLHEPKVNTRIEDNMLIVDAEVYGLAHELRNDNAEIDVALLRNIPTKQNRATEFYDGDLVYLSFKSAVDGYLAVFTRDDSVRCLLPYVSVGDGFLKVKANKDNVFFDEDDHRIVVASTTDVESNTLYVLFSPEKIMRPLIKRVDDGGLPIYSVDEFFAILGKLQQADEHLQVSTISFIVRKK